MENKSVPSPGHKKWWTMYFSSYLLVSRDDMQADINNSCCIFNHETGIAEQIMHCLKEKAIWLSYIYFIYLVLDWAIKFLLPKYFADSYTNVSFTELPSTLFLKV